jgi:hypothetical protein
MWWLGQYLNNSLYAHKIGLGVLVIKFFTRKLRTHAYSFCRILGFTNYDYHIEWNNYLPRTFSLISHHFLSPFPNFKLQAF